MHPDTPPSDRPPRLRLVDIRVSPGRQLHLGGKLAGILTESQDRSAAAHWIASTIAGPRPPESDGSIDIDGTLVSVHSLPSPMLSPGVPRVVDRELLRMQWRASCGRRRDELAATHASYRLERYRIEAALERARARPRPRWIEPAPVAPVPTTAAPANSAIEAVPPVADAGAADGAQAPDVAEVAQVPEVADVSDVAEVADVAEGEVGEGDAPAAGAPGGAPVATAPEYAPDEDAPLRAHLESLIATLEVLPAAPLPEGMLLADAWDAHSALVRVRDAVDALPGTDIERLEQRVDAARTALASTSSGIPEEVRDHIQQCHGGVLEAEGQLLVAKRRHRARAITGYEHAVAAELIALADAGIESYASFLLAVEAADDPANALARRVAQAEFAAARAAFDDALQVPDMPTRAELQERETQMRDRSAQLLGYPPGSDPAAELRALRVPTEGRVELLDEIADVLRRRGIVVTGDVVDHARAFLASSQRAASVAAASPSPSPPPPPPPPTPTPTPTPPRAEPEPVTPEPPRPVAVKSARALDVEALEQQRFAHDRALEQLDTDLAAIDAVYNADLAALGAVDLSRAVEVLLDAYRDRHLLAGQLPLVLDGALDGLGAAAREAAVKVLAAADDLQTIVVSDDVEVMHSLALAGGTLVRWPAREVGPDGAARLQPAPAPGA